MSLQNNKQTKPSLTAAFDQYIDETLRKEITGISRTAWWRLERQNKTPPSYRIGSLKRWLLSEVLLWLQSN
ncbi:helix-turn-helix transcriptional regulator [Pseudoalteromonas sp. AOP31-A2-14]|uniref:helix-turn-helix transcriptional regulator n=1 Tax=Pseudoalteromonas sp. AOP31-A2-14 TaxID=3457695 RepID=UPI004036EF3D